MISFILCAYAGMVERIFSEMEKKREEEAWNKWDKYEDMRNDMGVVKTTTPIPKSRKRKYHSHKKHSLK